jgi:hypothetical protein
MGMLREEQLGRLEDVSAWDQQLAGGIGQET